MALGVATYCFTASPPKLLAKASSAVAVQQGAAASASDGGPDSVLAGLGQSGTYAANVERDTHRRMRAVLRISIKPYAVEVPMLGSAGHGEDLVKHNIILPHELLADVSQYSSEAFNRRMRCRDDSVRFWAMCKSAMHDWF